MSVADYIRSLLASEKLGPQVRHHRCEPAREAVYAASRLPWPAAIRRTLDERGLSGLYSHQALATDHIRAGRSVVVATPTASGKSLIYNLPVLERHLHDSEARALYLFPLKALAQDQLAGLQRLVSGWPGEARPTAALYDGDTSDHFRRKIRRDPPTVLISNPEMLHLALLPHHEQWAPFLAGLSHIVVDEAHTYRGVFGAHMAGVFRRLNRLAAHYGAAPSYVFCTATVGNPGELAAALSGLDLMPGRRPPVVVDQSGAPQGARHYVFLDPEQSPATAAIDLLRAALARKLRTIVYCRSRRMTELVSLWAGSLTGPWAGRISAYRAGFLPEERRQIEARMASGELLAVVSTSALELGIDIGGLDVCILVGYPGTIMSTLQRGGRVGRAQQESAVVLVAGEDALDQYFMNHPEDFFSRPAEKAVVNPWNEVILARHLECAAAELPLSARDPWLAPAPAQEALRALAAQGRLLLSADGSRWLAARKRPQRLVDLRGTGQSFVIEDSEGAVIGSVDGFRAWRETHAGAVYLHRGRSYVIEEMDPAAGRVRARQAKTDWFTRVRGHKSTDILEEYERRPLGRGVVCRGRLRIIDTITGYEKRSTRDNRLLTIVPLDAPPQVFETEGLWYVIPESCRQRLEEDFVHFMGAIHACEHTAIGMLPLLVMADRNDFGGISIPLHPQTGLACVFIYDGLPGGAGLTRQAFGQARELLEVCAAVIAACPCEDGCPSCVHSPKCGSGNRPISKAGALRLIRDLLAPGGEAEGEALCASLRISPPPELLPPQPEQTPAAPVPQSAPDLAAIMAAWAGQTPAVRAAAAPASTATAPVVQAPAAPAPAAAIPTRVLQTPNVQAPTAPPRAVPAPAAPGPTLQTPAAPLSALQVAVLPAAAERAAGQPDPDQPAAHVAGTTAGRYGDEAVHAVALPGAAAPGAAVPGSRSSCPAPAAPAHTVPPDGKDSPCGADRSCQPGQPGQTAPAPGVGATGRPPEHYLVFDVETRRSAAEVGGWHKAGSMGVSIAVAYDSRAGDFFSYTQEALPELFARMRAARLVVGFNSFRFDYAVLAPFAPFDLRALPGLDLLRRVQDSLKYRVSLDNLGQATLGEPKSADGLQALRWWREGRLDDIAAYCRKDVDLTRRLYLFGLEHGWLLFTNKAGQRVRVPVDLRH
ncbi:DEAD/DEAH box helicase [uncultured Desulfovibrio sp.]|uniref:DEAD/DEAH box helicase n=1 Tax=uncultured Desulfovibrio sp. TaxID=167968 RepID=UPI002630FC5A|nr:DEAD/DEAH box helicase [uncultured Desulfovibrio sp.]